ITGAIRLPSIAVVAIVEPEIAENTVPATTATTASRPGTWRTSRSIPSITLTASPVWNSTSPIRTKSGIGVSAKLATEETALRESCTRPGSPPTHNAAPTRFTARKVKATGSPRKSSSVEPPRRSHAANCQSMSGRRHGVFARRARPEPEPAHAKQHFHREQQERDRQRRERPPFRQHQRLDRDRALRVAVPGRARCVDHDADAARERDRVAQPLAHPSGTIRYRAQDDIDADVPAFVQQPGRGEHRDDVERR